MVISFVIQINIIVLISNQNNFHQDLSYVKNMSERN